MVCLQPNHKLFRLSPLLRKKKKRERYLCLSKKMSAPGIEGHFRLDFIPRSEYAQSVRHLPVYDIFVEHYHTYFVEGVVAANKDS
jgi:hypothetical protein